MRNVSIPLVSEEEINRRYQSIRPVITLHNKLYDFKTYDFYEIIDYPKKSEDFYKDNFTKAAFESGYHVSTIRLYIEK